MNENVSCKLIQDLLPNYIEHLTSEETNQVIDKHLKTCDECREIYDRMNGEKQEEQEVGFGILKSGLNKTRRMYLLKGSILSTAILSVLVTAIINLAMDHTFSWFYIVLSSVLLVTVESCILLFKENDKKKSALLSLTVMILPYLFCLEKILNYYYFSPNIYWFREVALPITCIWIIVLWIVIFGFPKLKMRVAFKISLFSFIGMFAAVGTNYIALGDTLKRALDSNWINIVFFSVIGFLSLGIGMFCGKKK